jgi:hypothetical protein
MKRRLDDVCRVYCKELYKQTCQTCGIHKDSTPQQSLDWSHYISRRHLIVRWDIRNSLPMCRTCHQAYGDGINSPMQKRINEIWGEGTTEELESHATQCSSIKGTYLDQIEFRLSLEKYFKELTLLLQEGRQTEDCIAHKSIYTEFIGDQYEK